MKELASGILIVIVFLNFRALWNTRGWVEINSPLRWTFSISGVLAAWTIPILWWAA